MNRHKLLDKYLQLCMQDFSTNKKVLTLLSRQGLKEGFLVHQVQVGYTNGLFVKLLGENAELRALSREIGLIKNDREVYTNHLTIPVYDENKQLVNIVFYNPYPNTKNRIHSLNDEGIYNAPFLKNSKEIIFTDDPVQSLLLIQHNIPNTTFLFGESEKYSRFLQSNHINKTVFTMDGHAKFFYQLTTSGITSERIPLDYNQLSSHKDPQQYLESILQSNQQLDEDQIRDRIHKIENGFLFQFDHLNYRVLGNFNEYTLSMKANIKAYTKDDAFVDQIDLYKNRERTNFIFNLSDKFNIRDHTRLENDLKQITEVIEKHKENAVIEKQNIVPQLTEYQQSIGMKFLKNPDLIEELTQDITQLGYVRERENKILLYLLMTSRLLENPLHTIIISRSGAGKSQLIDIIEKLCPPEHLESISDLSSKALFYVRP